jgi:hypothetical protein
VTPDSLNIGRSVKYTESLTREELSSFVRSYLYRSRRFIVLLIYLVLTIALGLGVLLSGDRVVTVAFVVLMTWVMIGFVWAVLAEFRTLKVYSQSQYPQEFDFSETAISVTCANGIHYVVPWRHVRRIYSGRSYIYFSTAIGNFWVHKERFAEHLPAVTALWKPNRPHKPKSPG